MGIASGDYDGDGRSDLFVTNSRREPYAAFRHRPSHGRPRVRRRATYVPKGLQRRARRAGAPRGSTSPSTERPISSSPTAASRSRTSRRTRARFRSSRTGRTGTQTASFANVGVAGLRGIPRVNGRGLAAADFDNNGTVDIAIGSIGGRLVLLRNSGTTGHWLEVKLTTFAPGTVVTAVLPDGRKLVREVHAGSSYLSSEDPRVHFGLGDASDRAHARDSLPEWSGARALRSRRRPDRRRPDSSAR